MKDLESESIYIIREAAAQFENLALLFSGGKDSMVMLHLACKAFYPLKVPFPLLHVDTGHNFPETIEFRDKVAKERNVDLIVRLVQESINNGTVKEEKGYNASRNYLQTTTLLEAIEELNLDCCFGGARRDEEKSRAKERFFSHRNSFGEWEPKNQRPELWNLYNGHKEYDEHFRVFPLSNWTEVDIWNYIKQENIEIPNIYLSHKRNVFHRQGNLLAVSDYINMRPIEKIYEMDVRFRTVGDMTCTSAIESHAKTLDEVINEIIASNITERGARVDDQRSDTAMEDRKVKGYF